MADIVNIPLENAYETELSASIESTDVTITVDTAPQFTLPAGQAVYGVIDPKNSAREPVLITAISGNDLTVTRGQVDYLGGASTAVPHSGGATVIISDNWQIFNEYATEINLKADSASPVFTGDMTVPVYADATARDAGIPSPTNGMEIYNTAAGKYQDYTAGAWVNRESGGTFSNASTTVAGKVEEATAAELAAGTAAGGTGARLFVTPANTAIVDTSAGAADAGKWVKLDAAGKIDGSIPELKTDGGLEDSSGLAVKIDPSGGLSVGAAGVAVASSANVTHSQTVTADETITAKDGVCLLPYQAGPWITGLATSDLDLGDHNNRRRYAIKITPKVTQSTNTTMKFVSRDETGNSTMTITVTIEGDSAGEPDGTPITNGTANTISTAAWTTDFAERTATFASAPTLTKGTTYWVVFETDKTDAVDFVVLGSAATYSSFFPNFTRLIYDLDAATWGSSSTSAYPYFYFTDPGTLGVAALVSSSSGTKAFKFAGFAETTVAAEADVVIDTEYATLTGLTSGVPLYTGGAGATTATPGVYKIGRAYSATDMEIDRGTKRAFGNTQYNSTGTDATDYFAISIGFRIRRLTAMIGYGSPGTPAAHNIDINKTIDEAGVWGNNMAFYINGTHYGYSVSEGGATDGMVDNTTNELSRYTDSSGDQLRWSISGTTDFAIVFRLVDFDGCTATKLKMMWEAEGE